MMKCLAVFVTLLGLATAGVMPNAYGENPEMQYGSGVSMDSGNGGGYGGGSTGQSGQSCRTVTENIPQEHCEPYTNRVCHTTHRENCREMQGRNCRAVLSAQTTRKCFNVTETRCTLRENVSFESVQVPFVVQKCTKVNERVCGTVHETDVNTKDEVQCISVEKESCNSDDQVVNDRTCKTTVNFECFAAQSAVVVGPGSTVSSMDVGEPRTSGMSGNSGINSGMSGNNGQRQTGYGRVARDTYAAAGGRAAATDSSARDAYGRPQVNCRRTPETKCYNTPRTVSVQMCGRSSEEQCETVTMSVPFVTPKQSCHNEEKKVCQLEHRQQPKKVKKFEYTKQCRQVPRRVCENEENRSLVPSCVPTAHTQCSFTPTESCEDIPRQHCFQFNVQRQKTVCEETPEVGGYPTTTSEPSTTGSYGAPTQVDDY